MATRMKIYAHLADLLDYPRADLLAQARLCAALLAQDDPQAARQIQDFVAWAEKTPLGCMEEIYTGTFDVNPACYIFAGYLLFGESFHRGKFLVRLQAEYRQRGFSPGNELADHLAVMLRFLSTLGADEILAGELVTDCFLPVLHKMYANFAKGNQKPNPYRHVLRAILTVLEREFPQPETAPNLAGALGPQPRQGVFFHGQQP